MNKGLSYRPLIRYGDHVLKHYNDIIGSQLDGSQECVYCLLYGLTEIIRRCIIPIFEICIGIGLCVDERGRTRTDLGEVCRRTFYIKYTHNRPLRDYSFRITLARENNGNFAVVTFFPDEEVDIIRPIMIECIDLENHCHIHCHVNNILENCFDVDLTV